MNHSAAFAAILALCIALPSKAPLSPAAFPLSTATALLTPDSAHQDTSAPTNGEDRLTRVVLWYIFKALAVLVGGLAIYLGYRLFILGVTGKASLSIQTGTTGGQLLNAAPGLFFAIGGLALVAWAVSAK